MEKDFDKWNKLKKKTDKTFHKPPFINEGDIWWVSFGVNVGSEMSGKSDIFTRPAVILKKLSKGFFLVAPTTTQEKKGTWYKEINFSNKKSYVCLHQVRTIDYRRLYSKMGELEGSDFGEILNSFEAIFSIKYSARQEAEQSRENPECNLIINDINSKSSSKFSFEIVKKSNEYKLARVGIIKTPHGEIKTPAFISVGTKATVKALTSDQIKDFVGAQAVLANTYHLYLEPGNEIVKNHGGFAKMMDWHGPTWTDSGGFQVFSLGQAMGRGVSKVATSEELSQIDEVVCKDYEKLANIDEEGVTFKSIIDGSLHKFTPEKSMQIQHDLGADIFFAFDECTSPLSPKEYQIEAMERTHRWAERSLNEHKKLGESEATGSKQALFGVVQGGAYEDLRRESAKTLGAMDFDGYGIGGSFTKEDMAKAVRWVCEELPEEKPRHLLGIGEPLDILLAIENGIDTFDCVAPTRIARNGAIYTKDGRININNAKYKEDMSLLTDDITWWSHSYTKSYLAHLFRSNELLGYTIASIHNLKFITELVDNARTALLEDRFEEFKNDFLKRYYVDRD